MPSIFISYRRADSITITGRIYDRLVTAFGEENVFKDVDDIPVGEDFRSVLEREVNRSEVLLVIIGPRWLTIADDTGQRRLDDPQDFVRIEVESSLRSTHIIAMPVLVGGAALPPADELPASLRDLVYRNAAVVRDDPDFNRDINRLIQQIKLRFEVPVAPDKTSVPPPPSTQQTAASKRRWLTVVLALLAIVIGVGVLAFVLQNLTGSQQSVTPTAVVQVPTITHTPSPRPPTHTPAPTAVPTVTPTRTPLPPEGVAALAYALRNLGSYSPNSVDVTTTRPFVGVTEPVYRGTTQLFGSMPIGDGQQLSIVFDRTEIEAGQLYIDQNMNRDLTDDNPILLRGNGNESSLVPILLTYQGQQQTYSLYFYYSTNFNEDVDAFRLTYYPASYREGRVRLGSRLIPIVLDDRNVDGRFDTATNYYLSDSVLLDVNGDGYFGYDAPDIYSSLVSAIEVDGLCYGAESVEASGSSIHLEQVARGSIAGKVTSQSTGLAVGGAQVTVGSAQAVSDSTGQYRLSACPGRYALMRVTRKGYVPKEMDLQDIANFTVQADSTLPVDIVMNVAPESPSGEVVLQDSDSYHFLTGERGQYTGGDFYMGIQNDEAWFWANNDQRGLLSLGNVGAVDLYTVSFCDKSEGDFTRFGVQAAEGFTYVALPHVGEEGNYVVFRVKAINPGSVVLDFVYRDYC